MDDEFDNNLDDEVDDNRLVSNQDVNGRRQIGNRINSNRRGNNSNGNNISNKLVWNRNRVNHLNRYNNLRNNANNGNNADSSSNSNLGDKVADSKVGSFISSKLSGNSSSSNNSSAIQIPKSIKFKIYLVIGGIVLIFFGLIILIAIIGSIFGVGSGKVTTSFDEREQVRFCNPIQIMFNDVQNNFETSGVVSNNEKEDSNGIRVLLTNAVVAEIMKMVFPLNNPQNIILDNKAILGTDVFVDQDYVIFENIASQVFYELPVDAAVINNNYYASEEFIKAFAIGQKVNLYYTFSSQVLSSVGKQYGDSLTLEDSTALTNLTCSILSKTGRGQVFYFSDSYIDSDYLADELYLNIFDYVSKTSEGYSITTSIEYPFTYDTLALVDSQLQYDASGQRVIGGTYYLSDKKLEVSHEWLITNFPHFFDNNGRILYNYDDSKNANSSYNSYNGTQFSIIGAYYLDSKENKNYSDILNYFYDDLIIINNLEEENEFKEEYGDSSSSSSSSSDNLSSSGDALSN